MAAITASVAMGAASAYSAKRSADKQNKRLRKGQDASLEEQRRQYDQTREDFSPYREAGQNALNQLADPVANFYASPDYEFRRSEGMRDIGNQFAARGGGGNAMKALAGYNSNLASGEFGNWFNRTFSQAEAGRGATGSGAAMGQNTANNMSNTYMNTANNMATVTGNKYANLNNAMTGAASNALFSWGGGNNAIAELDPSAYAPQRRSYYPGG